MYSFLCGQEELWDWLIGKCFKNVGDFGALSHHVKSPVTLRKLCHVERPHVGVLADGSS